MRINNSILSNLREADSKKLDDLYASILNIQEMYIESDDSGDVFAGTEDSYTKEVLEQNLFDAIAYSGYFNDINNAVEPYNLILNMIIDGKSISKDDIKNIIEVNSTKINESVIPELPKYLIKYIDNEEGMDKFPRVVDDEGTWWFSVTQEEYDKLKDYVDKVDSIPEKVWRKWDDDTNLEISTRANNADRICRNSIIKESVDEEDLKDPNYKVNISNLQLTNGNYHNNSSIVFGKVKLIPRKEDLSPENYSVMYFCEDGTIKLFKLGTDVRTLVDYLYKNGDGETEWVKWNGNRVQINDIYNIIDEEQLKNIPSEQLVSIEKAINNAYFNEEPFPLNKVNYQ